MTAPPSATAGQLAEIMADHSVGSVILVEDEEPAGIVTDRDLAMAVLQEGHGKDTMASAFMTADVVTADGDDGVMDLCRTMRDNEVRRVPVVEDGKLTGIVTLDDVVVLLEDEMQNISEVIRSESPPY